MTYTILLVGGRGTERTLIAQAALVRELERIWPRGVHEVRVQASGLRLMPAVVPGHPLADTLVTVARRRGFDLDGHEPLELDAALVSRADLVLAMTRGQRAEVLLRTHAPRSSVFTLLEFAHLVHDAAETRRGELPGRGERLPAKLALAAAAAAARRRAKRTGPEPVIDLFDVHGYSLDIHETVAETVVDAVHAIAVGVAELTGTRARRGSHGGTAS